MIFLCLRHWVHNYHIDGFRFDLASILSRDRTGELVPNPPMVEMIAEDPLLADSKIIAEAWDASGAYQVGSFHQLRWAEWNGHYRDDVRRFWRGDRGMTPPVATRLAGSSDLYQAGGRQPYHSINFVTSHDGFTLNDLVSYASKHNEANEEGNRDGDNNNHSSNYGAEGPTRNVEIEALRVRQIKNMLATLVLSQGVPMLLYGDECRRTQRGNNNAYCQDNATSWFDWKLVEKNSKLVRFTKALIEFRRKQPAVRRVDFLSGESRKPGELPDVLWFGPDGRRKNWSSDAPSLTCVFTAPPAEPPAEPGRHVLLMFHAGREPREFVVPTLSRPIAWRTFLDTRQESPNDIFPDLDGPPEPPHGRLVLDHHSTVVFVSAASK
jgi:glycogen operon protein